MASKFQMVNLLMLTVITFVCGHFIRIRREPEVEVYGLPKQWLKGNNAATERIHLNTRLKVISQELNESDVNSFNNTNLMTPARPRPIIYTRPYRILTTNHSDIDGVLERVSIPSDYSSSILKRRQRSIDESDKIQLNDLEVAEGKIFRLLFVYRQQVAERHKRKRSQNLINGVYQYRPIIKKQNHVDRNNLKLIRNYN